jgi:hypothetical protein
VILEMTGKSVRAEEAMSAQKEATTTTTTDATTTTQQAQSGQEPVGEM